MGLAVPCELQPDRWYLSWWEPLDLQGGEFKLCPWRWAKDKAGASLAPIGFPWTRKRLKIRGKTREAKSETIIYWVLCCWTHCEVGLVLLVLQMKKWRTRVWSDQLAEGHRANYDQVCLLPCSPIGCSRLSRNTPMWQELNCYHPHFTDEKPEVQKKAVMTRACSGQKLVMWSMGGSTWVKVYRPAVMAEMMASILFRVSPVV